MSTSSSFASISQRITTTSTLLLERSRILSLSLAPSASSQTQIVRNLTAIRSDLSKLEDQLALESSGLVVGGRKRGKAAEDDLARQVGELQGQYDRLLDMFGEDGVGREKAKGLSRDVKRSPSPIPVTTPKIEQVETARLPQFNVEPPSPAVDGPFRDIPEDDDDDDDGRAEGDGARTPQDMLSEQQLLMDGTSALDTQMVLILNLLALRTDQDERLNLLSHSIGRQNHLSIQIGSELDLHNEMLEDTDQAMDRTTARLSKARKRLDKVASDAKQYAQ
ncbi:MAG: hypothetical protein TREMPRED_005144 [Tremellales sp. Tagirdzhanova-0007]|nr:MAG: hypothetical protein TREMPRED_005144 [Tremellales sp. Tagirdzhanova-0007]